MAANTYRIAFGHGLGDNVMLTSLLRQLRHNQPDCRIQLTVKPARVSLFDGLADEVIGLEDFFMLPLDVNALPWHFCETSYADSPSTNTEACLRDTYGITPAPEAWGYHVNVDLAKRQAARSYLDSLPRQHAKTCILHYRGNALKERKDLDDRTAAAIIRSLNARGYDSLIWDANDRSPLPEAGIGQLIEEAPPLFTTKPGDCGMLAALLAEADLVVGIDSGILHLASAVGTRAIGCWVRHHPLHFFCPDSTTTHLIPKKEWHSSHQWLVYSVGGKWDAQLGFFEAHYHHRTYIDVPGCNDLVLTVDEVLEGIEPTSEPVYLQQPEHDLRLRNWLAKTKEWTRQGWDYLPPMQVDRDKGFDFLLRFLKGRSQPVVIETGTTRAPNDFGGAGCATSVFGQFVQYHGGELHSVDYSERNVEFGRSWVREHGPRVQVHQADSVEWLKSFGGQVDLVYLDSCDLEEPHHAQHCLKEAQAIATKVTQGGTIAIDDTPEIAGEIHGKGKLAVPWLMGQGWETVHCGYQQILRKPT